MKKEILNIGKQLERKELTSILGGDPPGGLTPPPQCGGSGQLEPFGETACLLLDTYGTATC